MVWVFAATVVGNPSEASLAADQAPVPEAAQNQPPASTEDQSKKKMSPAEIRKMSDDHYKQCLQDWDAKTHMTKKDWQRACRRTVDERVKFWAGQQAK
jgi:hypothetical protein